MSDNLTDKQKIDRLWERNDMLTESNDRLRSENDQLRDKVKRLEDHITNLNTDIIIMGKELNSAREAALVAVHNYRENNE
jgi:predicted  nucleic acid-binding Zn-ribbon protein